MTLDCRFLVSILIVLCFLSAHRFVAFASAQDALEIGRIELADHETRILDAKDLPKGWGGLRSRPGEIRKVLVDVLQFVATGSHQRSPDSHSVRTFAAGGGAGF